MNEEFYSRVARMLREEIQTHRNLRNVVSAAQTIIIAEKLALLFEQEDSQFDVGEFLKKCDPEERGS